MLYGLLTAGYVLVCILLIFLILIQKGKSSTGFGAFGQGSKVLFGGSGGQDIFQKMTWFLGAIFMFGSLALSISKTKQTQTLSYSNLLNKDIPTQSDTPSNF